MRKLRNFDLSSAALHIMAMIFMLCDHGRKAPLSTHICHFIVSVKM